MKRAAFLFMAFLCLQCAHSQSKDQKSRLAGGPCEGCEAVFEYGKNTLNATDTLPGFHFEHETPLKLTGTIYQADGKTPAKDVVLYIYHTNRAGIYASTANAEGWARRHGIFRGWIKTGGDGRYTFYTSIPGTYPDRSAAAHIHPVILEPDGTFYWIQEYHFEGDTLLSEHEKYPQSPRGGSHGLLSLQMKDGILTGERDIILGKHIPGYH